MRSNARVIVTILTIAMADLGEDTVPWIESWGASLQAAEPAQNAIQADSPVMFRVPGLPDDPAAIDWKALPRVSSDTAVVFRGIEGKAGFNLHAYLAYSEGRFWAMWSSSPVDEDQAGQRVRFATSADGLQWSESEFLTPEPDPGMRFIARGFWRRGGEFLALASHDEAGRYFGPSLALRAYRWDPKRRTWEFHAVVYDDAINNFPPRKLPSGEWMTSRRDQHMHKSMLIGGVQAIDRWEAVPIAVPDDGARLEEPFWWTLSDGRIVAVFRDNSRSKRLYRAFSTDAGRTWSKPVRTNFPDAKSKFNVLRLTDSGTYVMASNPNPAGRNPLCLSFSSDGLVFESIVVLRDEPTKARYPGRAKGSSGYQYPHLLEHGPHLFCIHAENKEDIVVERVRMAEIARIGHAP